LRFLKRRLSVAIWEVIVLLVIAVLFATAYRIFFSRAVTLTQVCERIDAIQNSEAADMFQKLGDEPLRALAEVNRLCDLRRPMRGLTPPQ
jgi:hypothetical protein